MIGNKHNFGVTNKLVNLRVFVAAFDLFNSALLKKNPETQTTAARCQKTKHRPKISTGRESKLKLPPTTTAEKEEGDGAAC